MPDGFVPLEAFFAREAIVEPAVRNPVDVEIPPAGPPVREEVLVDERYGDVDAPAAVRRFHAALADALDAALDGLLRAVARDVLGRELALAPADVAVIADAALKRYAADFPVRLRAHPDDVTLLAGLNLAVTADRELRRGDVAIDVRSGTIDASLDARLERVLESMTRA